MCLRGGVMNNCCEKWSTLERIVTKKGGYFGEIKFCPECGSKLESEWCKCSEPKENMTGTMIHGKCVKVTCNLCGKIIEDKSVLVIKSESEKVPEPIFICNHQDRIHHWGKPKKELPEKLIDRSMEWLGCDVRDRINEIIDYLTGGN